MIRDHFCFNKIDIIYPELISEREIVPFYVVRMSYASFVSVLVLFVAPSLFTAIPDGKEKFTFSTGDAVPTKSLRHADF